MKKRCGYLSSSVVVYLTSEKYNIINLEIEGKNFNMADNDYYTAVADSLDFNNLKYDVSSPHYFLNHKYLRLIGEYIDPLKKGFTDSLTMILDLFEVKVFTKARHYTMMESIKNAFFGRMHSAHTPLIDYGIQAASLRGVKSSSSTP